MIVVDASIAVKWAVDEPGRAEALQVLDLEQDLGAPDLIFAELTNVLRKKVKSGEVTSEQAMRALDAVHSTITTVVGSADLWADALDLARNLDHSAYDCFYLAAAIGGGLLVSADEKFLRKCREAGFGAFVSAPEEASENIVRPPLDTSVPAAMLEDVERLASLVDVAARAFDTPAYRNLERIVTSLSVDRQCGLLALGWLGRSHHNLDDWPNLLVNAKQLLAGGLDPNRRYVLAQMAHVGRGLQKLRVARVETAS